MVQSDRARGTNRTRFLLQGILTCKILTSYEPNSYLYYIADALGGFLFSMFFQFLINGFLAFQFSGS
jgi:hypothetical protein